MTKFASVTLLTMSLLFAASCSKSPDSSPKLVPENSVVLQALNISTNLVDGVSVIPDNESTLDFGQIEYGLTATQEIIITNKQVAELALDSSSVGLPADSAFQMTSKCGAPLKRNRSCSITLSLANSAKLTEAQDIAGTLSIKGINFNLVGVKKAYVAPTTPTEGIVISPMHLDFGSLAEGGSKELTVIITNKSLVTQSIPSVTAPEGMTLTSACATSLLRNRSCSLKIKLTATEAVSSAPLFSFLNNNLTYSVEVATPPEEVVAVSPVSSSLSLALTTPEVKEGSITFKNTGTVGFINVEAVSSSPAITFSPLACAASFGRNRSCEVKYSINSSLLPPGASEQTIKLKSGLNVSDSFTLNLNVTVINPPVITYQPTYSVYSSCSVTMACEGVGSQTRSLISCQKLLDGQPVAGGTLADCAAFDTSANLSQACNSPAGNVSVVIPGGTKTLSCAAGSSVQIFASLACNETFTENLATQSCDAAKTFPIVDVAQTHPAGVRNACTVPLTTTLGSFTAPIYHRSSGEYLTNEAICQSLSLSEAVTDFNTSNGYGCQFGTDNYAYGFKLPPGHEYDFDYCAALDVHAQISNSPEIAPINLPAAYSGADSILLIKVADYAVYLKKDKLTFYKVPLNLVSYPQEPTFLYTATGYEVYPSDIFALGNEIIFKEESDGIFNYRAINVVTNAARTVTICSGCYINAVSKVTKDGSNIYLTANVINDMRVYRTTNMTSFTQVATGSRTTQYGQSWFYTQVVGNNLYFSTSISSTSYVKKINLTDGTLATVHTGPFRAFHVVGNKVYVSLANNTAAGQLYDVTNSSTSVFTNTYSRPFESTMPAGKYLYFIGQVASGGVYDLRRLDTLTNTVSLVKANVDSAGFKMVSHPSDNEMVILQGTSEDFMNSTINIMNASGNIVSSITGYTIFEPESSLFGYSALANKGTSSIHNSIVLGANKYMLVLDRNSAVKLLKVNGATNEMKIVEFDGNLEGFTSDGSYSTHSKIFTYNGDIYFGGTPTSKLSTKKTGIFKYKE